ncbi:hypothetical protein [Ornithinimicrobium cavernae]|uniref:hypothetical protein n=1 Tax=Ornithinimicrobium cavernae TaxID=2666047 RepID=UPI000D68653A|nr:hypothetical protein [Ornithinimicrobium cavernae]
MNDTAVVLLAVGIALAAGAFIAATAFFIVRYHQQPTAEATVASGPQGPVATVPTRQISVVRSSAPWLALARYAVRGTLTIGPDGLRYTRFLRGPKHLPYDRVRHAGTPDPSRPTLLTIHLTNGWGIVALTGTPQARHVALVELSRWVPVTAAQR